MAAKTSARRTATKARRQGTVEEADNTTTSPAETPQPKRKPASRSKKASRSSPKTKTGSTKKRSRGRPRVSNTDTERVTLRIEKEHLEIIDTLVGLKQYSNRSDAMRQAIKAFTEEALEDVEDLIDRQQKRQKLLQLRALQDQLAELQDQ